MRKKSELQGRARTKIISSSLAGRLAKIESPLHRSYIRTHICSSEITQKGKELVTMYCNCRWCSTCNRIRTAKLIDGYQPVLNRFKHKYFVTLTIPNVEDTQLARTIDTMIKNFQKIKDRIRKLNKMSVIELVDYYIRFYRKRVYRENRRLKEKGKYALSDEHLEKIIKEEKLSMVYYFTGHKFFHLLNGVRKLEVTYNPRENKYHPHFHFIMNGWFECLLLKELWLDVYKKANSIAQDVRVSNDKDVKELFKYFTKLTTKVKNKKTGVLENKYLIEQLDIIFQSMVNKRVFQSFGIKKYVSEDVEEIQAKLFEDIEEIDGIWIWDGKQRDWIHEKTGEILSGYEIDNKTKRLLSMINSS
jgi:plasmid rolling circle replication initiator protein Rep